MFATIKLIRIKSIFADLHETHVQMHARPKETKQTLFSRFHLLLTKAKNTNLHFANSLDFTQIS